MVARHLGGIHLIHMRMNRIQFECEESERTCAPIRPYIIWMHERHIIAGWLPFGQCNLYESSRILVFWCHIEICAFIRRKKATYDFFFYYNTINSWHLHFFFFCQAFVCVCVSVDPKQKIKFNNRTISQFHFVTSCPENTNPAALCMRCCIEQDFFSFLTTREKASASKHIENKINGSFLRSFNCCLRRRGCAFTRISFYSTFFFPKY